MEQGVTQPAAADRIPRGIRAQGARPPAGDAGRIAGLALAVAMLASLPILVQREYEATLETNDASMYVLCAQSLLRGEGYAYLGQPFTIRPPGMSLLIAPALAWRGLDFHALHALVSVIGIAGACLVYAWTRPRVGTAVAAALALCTWLNPGYQRFCNQVLSDVPGLAAMLAALWIERRGAGRASWRRDALLGLVIGLAVYLRTIAVVTLAAILVARLIVHLRAGPARGSWLEFARGRVLVLAGVTALVALPWSVRNARCAPEPPIDQNLVHSYATGILHVDPGDPASPRRSLGDLVETVGDRWAQVMRTIGRRFEGRGPDAPFRRILGPLQLLAVLFLLWRRPEAGEVLFLMTFGILLTYFAFRARLALPLYVIGLAAVAEVLQRLLQRRMRPARASLVVAGALAALMLVDLRPPPGRQPVAAQHALFAREASGIAAAVPGAERLGTRIGWHWSVYLGRPVWSLHFAVDRAVKRAQREAGEGPGAAREAEAAARRAIEAVVTRYALDALFVSGSPAEAALSEHLRALYGEPEPVGSVRIFRTRR